MILLKASQMGRIFTSITGPDFEACFQQLKGIKNAELRLDKVDLSTEDIERLWPNCSSWMVTIRKDFLVKPGWQEILEACLSCGPQYLDLDNETEEGNFTRLMGILAERNIRLILSYHNYEGTPALEELQEKARSMFEKGAEVVKLACMVNDYDDNVTLLRMYAEFGPIICIGMGEKGKVSRLNALYFGEAISYAAPSRARAVAPGQFTYEEMRTLEKALKCD
jgi:3-dehydroquinate dehydratase-1